jgi:hypothetical protein
MIWAREPSMARMAKSRRRQAAQVTSKLPTLAWRMGCTLKPSETSSQRQQAAAIGQMAVGCVG